MRSFKVKEMHMKEYFYRAKNFDGHIIKGRYTASNSDELIDYLHSRGYYPLTLRPVNNMANPILRQCIRPVCLTVFCRQFSVILQSGIPMIEALTLLSFQSTSRPLREALTLIIEDVKSGETLFGAFTKSKYIFPDFMIYMIKIGEESGRLDEVLGELSLYYERENKIHKKALGAMFYPVTVLIITIIIASVLMVTVVPSITSMLTSMGGKIPPVTAVVIFISSLLKAYLLHIALIAMILFLSTAMIIKKGYSDVHQRILMKAPVMGTVYRRLIEIKFSRAMSILLNSGMNLLSSLELTSNIIKDNKVKSDLNTAIQGISEGRGIAEALGAVESFEPLLISMLKVGEETGRLDEMLTRVTAILEDETQELILRLTEYIQPVMIIILSTIVGTILISVMLPIMSIMDVVG
jgi:type IV pilus assembly protein PilC